MDIEENNFPYGRDQAGSKPNAPQPSGVEEDSFGQVDLRMKLI
jgi:hypothetical protein